jgi:hypothetical protein
VIAAIGWGFAAFGALCAVIGLLAWAAGDLIDRDCPADDKEEA